MNPEDTEFVESLNCWEDNYNVITDNIQKLSGMLSLQIQLLQNIQEEKEDEINDKGINNLEKLKIAAQIIKTVIKDEEEKTGCTKYKAVDKIFTYLRTLIY